MKTCKVKKEWVAIEMEHAHLFPKNMRKSMAEKIARDHVEEMGCGYYPGLIALETKLRRKK